MEKICEFCTSLRPVVYCKADAALLCLSCDAKVHSANALSNRHPRTLLCELCKCRPASLRCLDHRLFLCRNCDRNLHEVSSQHHRRVIRSYVGCPSAKDFAALWGFELNALETGALRDQFVSFSCGPLEQGMRNSSFSRLLANKLESFHSVLNLTQFQYLVQNPRWGQAQDKER